MTKRLQVLTAEDAVITKVQHRAPCSDCPWKKDSVPGWLGSFSKEMWIRVVHSDARIDCHVKKADDDHHWQCAGAAIYRANMAKVPRDRSILTLPVDRSAVFSTPLDFLVHHETREGSHGRSS